MKGRPFIAVVDLETTGFAPPDAVPIEIGRADLIAGHDLLGCKWSEVDTSLLHWVLDRDFGEDVLHTARLELERRRQEAGESAEDDDLAEVEP